MGIPGRDQLVLTDTLSAMSRSALEYCSLPILNMKTVKIFSTCCCPESSTNIMWGAASTASFRCSAWARFLQQTDPAQRTYCRRRLVHGLFILRAAGSSPFYILKGFATNSKINQAKLAVEREQQPGGADSLQRSIDNEVETAKKNTSLRYCRHGLPEEKYEAGRNCCLCTNQKKKFEIGTGSQTEINTAQTDLKNGTIQLHRRTLRCRYRKKWIFSGLTGNQNPLNCKQ